jgi:molecular chaperone HscB
MINYFDFFDLPPAVEIDESLLRKRFLLNSKRFHPDFHTLESPEAQQHALEMASLNNEAWLVLSDFDRRIRHLLQLQDALPEEGQQKLPQDFLMEIMELNEALMEAELDPEPHTIQQLKATIEALEHGCQLALNQALATPVAYPLPANQLEALKNFYLKKRYLLRIRENLSKFAPH